MKNDRLMIGVIGHRNSGKTHTWNTLFGRTVRTGGEPRHLTVRPGECVEVFLVSGSPEERHLYVADILGRQHCRIVLCSMQYITGVHQTLDYFLENGFSLNVQWLNPGFRDPAPYTDDLALVESILDTRRSSLSIRDGQLDAAGRVQEIREAIYGWALYRNLVFQCSHYGVSHAGDDGLTPE